MKEYAEQTESGPCEPDPGMLAAVARLVAGCDELRRWLETSSTKAPVDHEIEGRLQTDKRLDASFDQNSYTRPGGANLPRLSNSNNNNDIDAVISETQSLPDSVPTVPHHALKSAFGPFRISDPGVQGTQASQQLRCSIEPQDILVKLPLTDDYIRNSKECFLQLLDDPHNIKILMEITNPELFPEDGAPQSPSEFVLQHREDIEHFKSEIKDAWPAAFPQGTAAAMTTSFEDLRTPLESPNNLRVWYLKGRAGTLSLDAMAMALQALLSSPSTPTSAGQMVISSPISFIRCVKRFSPFLSTLALFDRNSRCISIRACEPSTLGPWDSGLQDSPLTSSRHREFQLDRQKGRITNKSTGKWFEIREWCSTLYVDPAGTIVSWSDSGGKRQHYVMDDDVHYCGRHQVAYYLFLRIVSGACYQWESKWMHTLNKIDGLVSVKPSDTLNQKNWQTLMFDNGFEISETYFTILQMLRIFDEWIRETEVDFGYLKERILISVGPITLDSSIVGDRTILATEIDRVVGNQQSVARKLRDRIERKRTEIESLRDGLFNAASLREAVNARTLNLFVIIFTVITVIYTPLSFLAALWAMSNLSRKIDGDANAATPGVFIISWIALPIGTYLASMVFLFVAWVNTSPQGGSFWLKARQKILELKHVMQKLFRQRGFGFLTQRTRRRGSDDADFESDAGRNHVGH